jgi:hypothetical protein
VRRVRKEETKGRKWARMDKRIKRSKIFSNLLESLKSRLYMYVFQEGLQKTNMPYNFSVVTYLLEVVGL